MSWYLQSLIYSLNFKRHEHRSTLTNYSYYRFSLVETRIEKNTTIHQANKVKEYVSNLYETTIFQLDYSLLYL